MTGNSRWPALVYSLSMPTPSTLIRSLLPFLLLWLGGCTSFDALQSRLIFQPTDQQIASGAIDSQTMKNVWINYFSWETGDNVHLHGLWQEAERPASGAPVVLYLHGSRWDVVSSAFRIRRLEELGFSVLGIDYRGFGKSEADLPSENMAYEDARAAWKWLAARYPDRPRYIYGHSLGGAIAIELASRVDDESGTIVEGTFTSIPDVFHSFSFGWLPLAPLITQRFASVEKVAGGIGSPLLIVHGSNDRLIEPALGRKLFEAAGDSRKRFLLIEGGTHRNTLTLGIEQYRQALAELFKIQ